MVVGFLIVGMVAGLGAAGLSLLSGASFGWAFVAYMVAGNIAMMLAGLVAVLRNTPPDASSGTADHPHSDNRNARPAASRRPVGHSARHADAPRTTAYAHDRGARIRHGRS